MDPSHPPANVASSEGRERVVFSQDPDESSSLGVVLVAEEPDHHHHTNDDAPSLITDVSSVTLSVEVPQQEGPEPPPESSDRMTRLNENLAHLSHFAAVSQRLRTHHRTNGGSNNGSWMPPPPNSNSSNSSRSPPHNSPARPYHHWSQQFMYQHSSKEQLDMARIAPLPSMLPSSSLSRDEQERVPEVGQHPTGQPPKSQEEENGVSKEPVIPVAADTTDAPPLLSADNDDADKSLPPTSSSSQKEAAAAVCPTTSTDEDDNDLIYTYAAAPDSKYTSYHCVVDSTQEDRAVEIPLGTFSRPHMRAFHLAWMSFFVAFFTWFALTPLLSEVALSLDLSHEEVWNSSIFAVAGSAVTRVAVGPLCDAYGARWNMAGTLVLCAIPTALTGLVQTSTGLNVLRLFIGVAGSAFVTATYWSTCLFTREVSGTANALVAGWGNLGGGVTQLVMGSLLFPLFKIAYGGSGWSRSTSPTGVDDNDNPAEEEEQSRAAELAWRTCLVVPALLCFATAYAVLRHSDDSPKGNVRTRSRRGLVPAVSVRNALGAGFSSCNTWVLVIHYGCCFGVEITMVNAAALYFKEEFGQSTESAAAIASIFGWMNLFARGVGGLASDIANAKAGMRGRLGVHVVTLVLEGFLVILFSKTDTLATAIVAMIFFSIFVQAAEGSTFAIVPYVNPAVTGSISGIIGAGGNVGGVVFAILFREYDYRKAFSAMGYTVVVSAVLSVLLYFPGHRSLFCGKDAAEVVDRRESHTDHFGTVPAVAGVQQGLDGTRRPRLDHIDKSMNSPRSRPRSPTTGARNPNVTSSLGNVSPTTEVLSV